MKCPVEEIGRFVSYGQGTFPPIISLSREHSTLASIHIDLFCQQGRYMHSGGIRAEGGLLESCLTTSLSFMSLQLVEDVLLAVLIEDS